MTGFQWKLELGQAAPGRRRASKPGDDADDDRVEDEHARWPRVAARPVRER